MGNLSKTLKYLGACKDSINWAKGKTPEKAWATCERGDWMLWIYARSKNYEKRKDILVRGYCTQLVIPHMKDSRSIDAVYAAINYGNGHISDAQLIAAADAAFAAAHAAANAADAADSAAHAAYAAARAARAAYAAYAAWAAANAAYAAADAAGMRTLKQCADICRKHLPMPIL